jgi:hypothetical protein
MDAAPSFRVAREHFARDVRQALGQVPAEIAASAVGHAVLAEALVQIAADIVRRHDNYGFLEQLMRSVARPDDGPKTESAGNGWSLV